MDLMLITMDSNGICIITFDLFSKIYYLYNIHDQSKSVLRFAICNMQSAKQISFFAELAIELK